MRASIIGAGGRMGSWLSEYLRKMGLPVTGFDSNQSSLSKIEGIRIARSAVDAVKEAELVILSVPPYEIPKVVERIAERLQRNSILLEISSIKGLVYKVMKSDRLANVTPVSIHPLFGPGADSLKGRTIALIPLNDMASEKKIVRKIFPQATLVVTNHEEHDKAMGHILSLTHLLSIAFAHVIAKEDMKLLKMLGGTTFSVQLMLAYSVLHDSPNLLASLQIDNAYSRDARKAMLLQLKQLSEMIEGGMRGELAKDISRIRKVLAVDSSFDEAYRRLYKCLSASEG